ncbi:MAG: 5-formyltetrahydrofolate cyclo-ligase [Sterolibacterium sp.]|jgi:5,10-methenyltetrahydrofolate synthetase|nr:5-formyltetrahydrofolate cyclo-ligase [Sterolibacterium sp.]
MTPRKPAPDLDVSAVARRAELRREKLAARRALSAETHRAWSQSLEHHLETLLHQHPPQVLGFYWPIHAEFDARPLVTRLLATGRVLQAGLPVVQSPDQPLAFRAWTPGGELQTDRYGISFPAAGATLAPDVLLIPVNAFDAQGYRLGYGSGFFDRTLAALKPRPYTIGIGFELARVASIFPEPHDVPLEVIVTETGVFQSLVTSSSTP